MTDHNGRRDVRASCLTAVTAILFLILGSKAAHTQQQITSEGAKKPALIDLWKFDDVYVAYKADGSTYVSLKLKNGKDEFWDPISGTFLSPRDLQSQNLKIAPYPGDGYGRLVSLSNHYSISSYIKSSGSRCGYAVGVYYVYGTPNEARPFYVIDRFHPAKKTSYCSAQQNQAFDASLLSSAVHLTDGRILLVDDTTGLVVALTEIPHTIISLDNRTFLVPAELLQPSLDSAGDNQVARYKALLQTLKQNPATMIRPTKIE